METSEFWEDKQYYAIAKKEILSTNHYGMQMLKKLCSEKDSILDIGCGDGTRLSVLPGEYKTGVDISRVAINLAKNNYPDIKFIKGDIERLPFKDNLFDITYSAFVLEHLRNTERVISEMIRVTRNNGKIVLIAPNYGAPNRASPVYRGSRIIKLLQGYVRDIFSNQIGNKLNWKQVKADKNIKDYVQDIDTLVEPYLGSLIKYLKYNNLKIIKYNSCWDEELPDAKYQQKLFRVLGESGMYPFTVWGPHLVVVAEK
jgi:ubiquinone/menaquinone biosynthesis C-methylase UbiE